MIKLTNVCLAGILIAVASHAYAGTLNGMDDPNRIAGKWIVVLKRDHIVSLRNPALTDPREITSRSANWKAARAAADAEVGGMVAKLRKAHPKVKISAVVSRGQAPGFVLKASDEDAKAIANEDDVAEVDADTTTDAIKNVTMTNSQSPAPSWGLERIDQLPSVTSPSAWVNSYNWIATGAGADVYIIDSGIMTTNVDFGGRATNDADFIVDGNNGWCASNINGVAAGHGTEVASIAGGSTYGVAKLARLHSVRVTDCNGAPDFSAFLEALEWTYGASKNQLAVVNISLEYLAGNLYPFANLAPATQAFVSQSNTWLDDIASAGIGLVIAAGNNPSSGSNIDPGNSWPQDWNSWDGMGHGTFAFVVGALFC